MTEYAIQNSITGEYWAPVLGWTKECKASGSYGGVATMGRDVFDTDRETFCDAARIVSAPPRKMTDAECWEWLKRHDDLVLGWAKSHSEWWVMPDAKADNCLRGQRVGDGSLPEKAIRSAAKKIGA